MHVWAVVTIVINGAIVSSAAPARLAAGRVVAPIAPVVAQLAQRIRYDPGSRTVTIERGGRRFVVPVAFIDDDVPYVGLAAVVRGLGGSTAFDSRTQTLAIVLRADDPIATPVPFDRRVRQADATTIFTPQPAAATPRGVETGMPRPRRTAIPVVPSQPGAPPGSDLITPRRPRF